MTASAILMVTGAVCVYLSGWMMYSLIARASKAPSQWTSTYLGAASVAMCVIVLLLAGITLIAKGLLSPS